jgi:hypothetical protein
MPLPPGIVFPNGMVFAERATLTAEEMPFKPVRIWYKGMRYLGSHNAAMSLHAHDGMFRWAELSAHGSMPDASLLASSIQLPIVALDPFQPHYASICAVLGASRDAAILRHAATTQVPTTPPRPSNAALPGASAVTANVAMI